MKFVAAMRWVESKNEWHMETPEGNMLQEFFNCENLPRVFDNELDKEHKKLFVIDVRLLNKQQKDSSL